MRDPQESLRVIVLAGPNGAGKTTTAPRLLRDGLGLASSRPSGGSTTAVDRIDRAMAAAFQDAVRLHRAFAVPLVVWREERVTYVDPWTVALPEDPPAGR